MTLSIVTDPAPAPVIHLDPGKQSEIRREGPYCRHRQYVLDEGRRSLECGSCGAPLDPYEVLLDYAQSERRWVHFETEARRAEARLDELKAEERKVKARTKSASRKEAAAAVAAERLRTERERMEISELARDVAGLARRIERTARALAKENEGS